MGKQYKPFQGNQFTQHGKDYEEMAIQHFTAVTSYDVDKVGTVISKMHKWLSASPDGLIGNDAILEVKCPFPDEKRISLKKYDLMKLEDDRVILNPKGSCGYYTQLQLTMFCTGRQSAFFWAYFSNDPPSSLLLICEYDEKTVSQLLARLDNLYFKHMLPKMASDINVGHFKILRESTSFVSKLMK